MEISIISKIKAKIALLYLKFGKPRGSLLLELAIVISIIGLISGFFIKKTIAANSALRIQITKNNIETVTMALASYVANQHRLPRPAADRNGYENSVVDYQDLSNFVGYVPFNTLGIPAKTALDGEAKPLIYAVEPSLTNNFGAIYEENLSSDYFCYPVVDAKIFINELTNLPDIVAFSIDTADNFPKISDKITITISKNTIWISRDMILMKYLKNPPCKAKKQPVAPSQNDVFDF
ncbi:MAG: hypothetical protein LBP41_02215 [Holosporaceae bacterium]|jgi:type II secretory pathway pseudopilin PulG|nr:hypothetical protein [Holosporaceae bacterium]